MDWSQAYPTLTEVLTTYSLITAFVLVGITIKVSYFFSSRFTRGRFHGSAVAILIGLAMAWIGGVVTGGDKGIADVSLLSGMGLMGGVMLRDLAIVATAFGVRLDEIKQAGTSALLSLAIGLSIAFFTGAVVAWGFGYKDAVSITTIAAGTATFVVGPITGTALGASSDVITLSIAAGLIKAIVVMLGTPLLARRIGLNSPRAAMVFGSLVGSTCGVASAFAVINPKLIPYAAMTAVFYLAIGCLIGPTLCYMIIRLVVG